MISQLPVVALFSTIWFNRLWYSLPLVIVISLVYAATRHELMAPILDHALRFGRWILGFMAIVFLLLALLSAWL
jgi:hypothetical protein